MLHNVSMTVNMNFLLFYMFTCCVNRDAKEYMFQFRTLMDGKFRKL